MKFTTVCLLLIVCVVSVAPVEGVDRADINCAADVAGCCCRGMRGNVDCDFNDEIDIVDLTMLIDHLFITLAPLPSVDEANIDGQDRIDISDLTRLIDFLYISLTPLPGCPGSVNHPPVTLLLGKDSTQQPYVNATTLTETNTGIHRSWTGIDKLDHPYEPQPLRFEWRMYGPFDSSTFVAIETQFRKYVFLTTSGEVIRKGQGNYIVYCDTVWLPTPPYIQQTCDTLFVDTINVANRFGTLDTLLDVDAAAFKYNPAYNKIVLQSGASEDSTTTNSSIVLLNLFRNAPSDTTQEGSFIFWVRAIDRDFPPKADPTPQYERIKIVDGKHEYDILIADAQISYEMNPRILHKAKQYWIDAIARWRPSANHMYHMISQSQGNVLPTRTLVQFKTVVIVSDDVLKGVISTPLIRRHMMAAMQSGTNFWFCGRSLLAGTEDEIPQYLNTIFLRDIGPWLGLNYITSTGWSWYALKSPSVRIEDFIGAEPIIPGSWPTLTIDSGYLHTRYRWDGDLWFPFVDSLAALPEVTFFDPVPEAEKLYTYKSLYTDHHPVVPDSFFFAGKTVVYRLDRDAYRIFVSSFTPYSLTGDSVGGAAQVFIDSVFNWLYEPFTQQSELNSVRTSIPNTAGRSNSAFPDLTPIDVAEVKP
jgi:hypothetical protein